MEGPLRVLEFYSGIGGMRYALEQVEVLATVVEAFEINDMANDVYEYNFGHRPYQGNIQHITMQKLDDYEADAWLLSPPCQPYTRQGLQKDAEDARASSFLKLLEMLSIMSRPPAYLFVENVVGFECSISHCYLVEALKKAEFLVQEFILTPLQFGIPYSRPRYFCLAKRLPYHFLYPELNNQLSYNLGPTLSPISETTSHKLPMHLNHHKQEHSSISAYLEEGQLLVEDGCHDEDLRHTMESHAAQAKGQKLYYECLKVSDPLIDRWGDAFDVVTPNSKRCCCFTKSYGRFVKGTGSFLATEMVSNGHDLQQCREEGDADAKAKSKSLLKQSGLRYFTPREIANLHSFPKKFKFPEHLTLKQRYALLGNSLSVAVVASLLSYLFRNE